jgi:hypothetical protein
VPFQDHHREPADMQSQFCSTCRNAKIITSDHSSLFYRCQLSDENPHYSKYPRLPVLNYAGWIKSKFSLDT